MRCAPVFVEDSGGAAEDLGAFAHLQELGEEAAVRQPLNLRARRTLVPFVGTAIVVRGVFGAKSDP